VPGAGPHINVHATVGAVACGGVRFSCFNRVGEFPTMLSGVKICRETGDKKGETEGDDGCFHGGSSCIE